MSTAEKLLDAAETRMRTGGFHAVSFRDLADDLSIKSASVHYYYRHKEDLGAAVVARYRERVLDRLDVIAGPDAEIKQRIEAMCIVFREALVQADQVCLCGVLGAEALGLPGAVRTEVSKFLGDCAECLAVGFRLADAKDAQARALTVLAALEGAMILAVSQDDIAVFDLVADQVKQLG